MKKHVFLSPLIIFLAMPIPVNALPVNETALNTIVITGSRTELNHHNTPADYIFTADEIEASSASNLSELLTQVPGLIGSHNGGKGAVTSINSRGTESDHLLIIIDGVRSASASTGVTSIEFLPLSQIARIEISKRPQSGIYGADAIGGVIQIVTKKAENHNGGYTRFSAGSHNTREAAAGWHSGNGDWYYGVNASQLTTDGINRKKNTTGPDNDRDGFDEKSVSINVGKDTFTGVDVDFFSMINQGNTQYDAGSVADSTDFKEETSGLSATYDPTSKLKLQTKFGYFKSDQVTFGHYPSRYITRHHSNTSFLTYTPVVGKSWVIGYNLYHDKLNSTTQFDKTERHNQAGFIEYGMAGDLLDLQLTYRNDNNDSYGNHHSGSVLIGLPITDHQQFSIAYGTAFKAPTFNDLYFPRTTYSPTFTYQGNKHLLPEISRSLELSYSSQLSSVSVDASIYKTEIDDLISNNVINGVMMPDNINKAELLGAELTLSKEIGTINWSTAISHVDAKDKTTDTRLNRRPRTTLNARINKTINQLSLSATWIAEDGRRQSETQTTGGYGLLNLQGRYDLSPQSHISIAINNTMDKDYVLVDGYQTEGRTINMTYKQLF